MKRIFQNKKGGGDNDDRNNSSNNNNDDDDDNAWNPNNSSVLKPSSNLDEFGMMSRAGGRTTGATTPTTTTSTTERPNYRGIITNTSSSQQQSHQKSRHNRNNNNNNDDEEEEDDEPMNINVPVDDGEDYQDEDEDDDDDDAFHENKAVHIEKSAGTSRLNRILRDASTMSTTATPLSDTTILSKGMGQSNITIASILGAGGERNTTNTALLEKVSNPRNIEEMIHFVGRVVIPPLRVTATTIGGHMLDNYPISMQQEALYVGICHNFESTNTSTMTTTTTTTTAAGSNTVPTNTATTTSDMIYMSTLQYPHEYSNRKRSLGLFSTTTTTSIGNKYRTSKIRYIIIGRSTNRPLLKITQKRQIETLRKKQQELLQQQYLEEEQRRGSNNNNNGGENSNESGKHDGKGGRGSKKISDDSDRDYDTMFAPEEVDDDEDDDAEETEEEDGSTRENNSNKNSSSNNPVESDVVDTRKSSSLIPDKEDSNRRNKNVMTALDEDMDYHETVVITGSGNNNTNTKRKSTTPNTLLMEEEEISSFPVLICMTLQNDGTGPDIRKLIPLDQLTTIQDLNSTIVQLAFNNGDTIRIDFGNGQNENGLDNDPLRNSTIERKGGDNTNNISMERSLDKERFIWSILQIHAMLCMSVVERNSRGTNFLLPLNVRNVDRAELQYIATINGFIPQNESIRILLERQRKLILDNETSIMMMTSGSTSTNTGIDKDTLTETPSQSQPPPVLDMDEMAYDLMMGNFATRVTLFHSEDERKDAEEILNSPEWTEMFNSTLNNTTSNGSNSGVAMSSTSAAMNVAERLTYILQSRMRDLEAETCRRLIAWEDEKHVSLSNKAKLHDASDSRDTVDALALASLFKTLESLDSELKAMEDWLQERAAAIKPLTDDCADIEEENRQLEQQWKSYDMLGNEMKRLLHGQELDETTETILKNPASVLVYDEDGLVNVEDSEDGIERLYDAGKALLDAIEFPRKCGGIHLKAVAERAKGLTSISHTFCSSLAQIIVTVMEQFKTEVVAGSDHGKVSKNDTHTMISKKIRDTQRKFQSALLSYIKLIEILAALSPEMLPALRDAYAELVAEGILMKKRMKGYFQALPGKNTACLNRVGKNIKDYVPFDDTIIEETVNAPDIRAVLSELLPVIAREAYFTSALFGSMNREQDGREKKRNFENAKNAVDKASVHFRYYLNRTCGVVDTISNNPGDADQKGDPLLSLVATIYLNEIMDSYVDREKKGGDHSLSLAYVRATILDLRKKADKQWVNWVEQQIEWVKSNDGVPMTGKRAGIFPSFARFPVYLDHVIKCCKEGREDTYFPDLPGIKVINYYLQKIAVTLLESLKDCARRDTTDQSYASHVMQMENTYFFTQAIKERGEVITKLFAKQVTKANAICKESTDAYLGWMIKREFTALHELFSRVSKIRKELGDGDVVSHVPKAQFVKTLQKEANRDILKEKIGTMYSRMEKHLSEEGQLLPIAWKALVKVLYEWFGRWEKLCTSIYKHRLDPSSVDVVRIAKAAGGGAVKSQGAVSTEGTTEFGFKSILALGNKQGQKP